MTTGKLLKPGSNHRCVKTYHPTCDTCLFEKTVEEVDTVVHEQERHVLAQGVDHVVGFTVVG